MTPVDPMMRIFFVCGAVYGGMAEEGSKIACNQIGWNALAEGLGRGLCLETSTRGICRQVAEWLEGLKEELEC